MAFKIPEIFYAFGPQLQLNKFMSVGILLKYFRRKLLQFEWSKAVSNLGMSHFATDQVASAASFTRTSHTPYSKMAAILVFFCLLAK